MTFKSVISGVLLLVLLIAGGLVYSRIQAGKETISLGPMDQRQRVGEVRFEDAGGNRTALSDLRGKPVVIDVWASWCGPCLRNLPQLVELKQKYQGRVEVLGLNVDSEGWPAVERFRQQFPQVNFPLVRPVPEPLIVRTIVTIEGLGQVSVLPSAFLIDSKGRLAGKYVGLEQMERLHRDVGALLGQ